MITYSSKVDNWNVDTAEPVIPGSILDESTGRYFARFQGINAKYLGDTVYLACSTKLHFNERPGLLQQPRTFS